MPPFRTAAIQLTAAALLLLATGIAFGAERYTFGIVPQQSAVKTAQTWAPIVQHLGRATGATFVVKTEKDIPSFERQLQAGGYDFAYMNSYHYVSVHDESGYRAFAKARNKQIRGIVVLRKDSPVNSLQELAGEAIAFPAPGAFAASLLPRAELRKRGIPIRPVYVSSHDLVYLNVARGRYIAGGGVLRTLQNMDRETRAALRVLWTTDGHTPHAIASHPRVPDNVVTLVQRTLIGLDGSVAGKAMLQNLKLEGFEAANDAAWDDIRQLELDSL
jgi:phosphonate transport system substrate-binding protein